MYLILSYSELCFYQGHVAWSSPWFAAFPIGDVVETEEVIVIACVFCPKECAVKTSMPSIMTAIFFGG